MENSITFNVFLLKPSLSACRILDFEQKHIENVQKFSRNSGHFLRGSLLMQKLIVTFSVGVGWVGGWCGELQNKAQLSSISTELADWS